MGCASFRALIGLAVVALAPLALPSFARAQECTTGCAHGRVVCSMQARTGRAACMQSCTFGDVRCHSACVKAARSARATCRTARADCATTCPAAATSSPSCAVDCSTAAKACFADVLTTGTTCVESCKESDGSDLKSCLEQCAATIGRSGAICLATFEGCLIGCQGQATGACFSTTAMECTAEPCGPGQACSQPDAFCSERCSTPPPSGTCLDLGTRQCTNETCSPAQPCGGPGQVCVPVCPLPIPQGQCFDPTTNDCTDQPCDLSHRCPLENQLCTLQCPRRTPVPQCAGVPCEGPCAIDPPCLPNQPCPKYPSRLGQCMPDAAGNCGCVAGSPPPTPTPQPTPMSPCEDPACGGPCVVIVPVPCALGAICNGPRIAELKGQCTVSANGQCNCVPVFPTPPATPTPQCNSAACGGPCFFSPRCPPGFACPAVVLAGHCDLAADGSCGCMPDARETPTPGCAADADCGDDNACTADRCVNGVCEHACLCVSAGGEQACCPGPAAFCVTPCGSDATGACGGACPFGASCESTATNSGCGCVSGPGGPCGGNIFAPPAVCAAGLVCHQTVPDATGYCEKPNCVPLFTSGCSETSDCCEPCGNGTHAPCGVCSNGVCEGAP